MRTIKRCSIPLNLEKKEILQSVCHSYAKEKKHWLKVFQQIKNIPFIKKHRIIRDQAVHSNYQSSFGLQARMWKLALQDAADTMDKYWKSIFDKIKSAIHQSNLNADQKHYSFWLLKDYSRLAGVLSLKIPAFKNIEFKQRKQVINYLGDKLKTFKKNYPKVKIARSFVLDDNCYNLFEHLGRQYINVMTSVPRKRIAIPLSGQTPIRGNIRLILKSSSLEVHYTSEIKKTKSPTTNNVIAVDFGYTEVMTDSEETQYGLDFGNILSESSDKLKIKMQNRHKLHALQKKYAESHSIEYLKKARNIRHNNLGRIKLEEQQRKLKARLSVEINTAFNQLAKKRCNKIISENLSRGFEYNRGRQWNRRLSSWVKGELKERLAFKALAKGFSHEQVNPAYTSQICVICDYVDSKNRKGDKFKCLYCGHVGHADWIAAMNLRSRYFDREITRYTPYREVKNILLRRFHRHLETKLSGTVSGRIPDTAVA